MRRRDFSAFPRRSGSRSAGEILAHMGDLLDWGVSIVRGAQAWQNAPPQSWDADVDRFFKGLAAFDAALASAGDIACSDGQLFQGPVADLLTHSVRSACCGASPDPLYALRTISSPTSPPVASAPISPRRATSSDMKRSLIVLLLFASSATLLDIPLSAQPPFKAPPLQLHRSRPARETGRRLPRHRPHLQRVRRPRSHVPGAAWGDRHRRRARAHRRHGLPRRRRRRRRSRRDSVFRIASMTKSFTAIAILKLRDEGKLSLDDPAEKYVPEMKALDVSDERLAEDHDPPSAVARRRVPRGQPVGRPAARRHRRAAVAR